MSTSPTPTSAGPALVPGTGVSARSGPGGLGGLLGSRGVEEREWVPPWPWLQPVAVALGIVEHRDTPGGAMVTLSCTHVRASPACPQVYVPARGYWAAARSRGWVARPLLRDRASGRLSYPRVGELDPVEQDLPPIWWTRMCPHHAHTPAEAHLDPDGHLHLNPTPAAGLS